MSKYGATDLDRAMEQGDVIAAGAWHFQGGTRRLDALLAEFGYERTGRAQWERVAGDDTHSLVLAPCYEPLTGRDPVVAVLGRELYRETPTAADLAAAAEQHARIAASAA